MSVHRRIVYPDADGESRLMFSGDRLEKLEAIGDFTLYPDMPKDTSDFIERIGDAEAILLGWSIPDEVLTAAPNLEIIAFTGIGAANFVNLDLAAQQGITVTNTPGYADNTIAEHAMGLMLAASRNITLLDRDTRAGGWNRNHPGFDLRGRTLGLIGLGGIGKQTAQLAQAFGMRVIAWTRTPSMERASEAGVVFKELEDVLRESDIVSLHLALTPDTENMLGEQEFVAMKNGAVLINTARAEIVNEEALIKALETGLISVAGLDVFHEEPLPIDHPFRKMNNVVMTPHTGFNTPEATAAIMDIAIGSVAAYFAGSPINVVAMPE